MTKQNRFDVQKFDGYEVMPQGFLRIPVYAGRTGVQSYRKNDGKVIREYRPPEEVFSDSAMGSLRSCPFTNNHPTEMVNVDNAKDLMCGHTVDHVEKVDNKYLKTYVVVYDKKTIEDIKSGKREVSMGYDVELEFTPGEVNGQKYDAIQRNIVHNHIALVDRARGGREVRLRLDGQDAILVTDQNDNPQEDNMAKIKLGEKEFEVAQDVADALSGYTKEMDAKAAKVDGLEADLTKVQGQVKELETAKTSLVTEKDSLQAKVDGLEADKAKGAATKMDSATVELAVKERRRIDKVAEKILGEEEFKKADEMSASDLKKAVIKAECKDADLTGKSEAYVDARFDHIAEHADVSSNANAAAGKTIAGKRKDAGKESANDSEAARQKSMKEDAERWNKPVGKQEAK